MTQKEKQRRHGNVIGEMAAFRWEPTHITKHCPRVVPLQQPGSGGLYIQCLRSRSRNCPSNRLPSGFLNSMRTFPKY